MKTNLNIKKIINICAAIAAVLAILIGLCLFFATNGRVREVVKGLEVVEIEDEYHLVAKFNSKYSYQFKIEQQDGESFFEIAQIESKTNSINLSQQEISLVPDTTFRFSARFVKENSKGEFCQPIVWSVTSNCEMPQVDYSTVQRKGDILSWGGVEGASSYDLVFVDEKGDSFTYETDSAEFDLTFVPDVGHFKVFVIASFDEYGTKSEEGEGFDCEIVRKNQISNVQRSGDILTIYCSLQVDEFEIFADGECLGRVSAGDPQKSGNRFVYRVENILLANVDYDSCNVTIKSVAGKYVEESEQHKIS